MAATTMYVAAFLERAFKIFESAAGEVGRVIGGETNGASELREDARMDARA